MNSIENTNLPKAIFLMGPTCSGKTSLAIKLCEVLPVQLISVDSALVYREMNIGTAKPTIEQLKIAPHRLLDIIDPSQIYSVADFRRDALTEMSDISKNDYIPLLIGGTMLYYKALLHGLSILPPANANLRKKIKRQASKRGWQSLHQDLVLIDKVAASKIHPNDSHRLIRALEIFLITGQSMTKLINTSNKDNALPYKIFQFIISPINRELLYKRIEYRFYQMLKLGFIEEVQKLFSRGDLNSNMPSIRSIGYRQIWSWLEGKISYKEMINLSICATKQLAKSQLTWLRNWREAFWLESTKPKQAINFITQIIKDNSI